MTIPFYVLLVLTSSIGSQTTVDSIATFQTLEECGLVAVVVSRHIGARPRLGDVIGGDYKIYPNWELRSQIDDEQTEVICEEISK